MQLFLNGSREEWWQIFAKLIAFRITGNHIFDVPVGMCLVDLTGEEKDTLNVSGTIMEALDWMNRRKYSELS